MLDVTTILVPVFRNPPPHIFSFLFFLVFSIIHVDISP